jgi:hypothetical protein
VLLACTSNNLFEWAGKILWVRTYGSIAIRNEAVSYPRLKPWACQWISVLLTNSGPTPRQ